MKVQLKEVMDQVLDRFTVLIKEERYEEAQLVAESLASLAETYYTIQACDCIGGSEPLPDWMGG